MESDLRLGRCPYVTFFSFHLLFSIMGVTKRLQNGKEAWHENRLIFTAWLVKIQNGIFFNHSAKSSQIGRPVKGLGEQVWFTHSSFFY